MTVSAPATFASAAATTRPAPKSRVTVSVTGAFGSSPAPMAQPPRASAATRAASVLADMEHDAVAAAPAPVVAVVGAVDDVRVEHVAPARELGRKQVARVLTVADGEPEALRRVAAPAARDHEALELAAEVRAAAVLHARQAQLHRQQPGRIGIGDRVQRARPASAGEAPALVDVADV